MIFHFGNAPISRLIAQDFSIQLGSPFRTTAITTGISQVSMIVMALIAPWLITRFGLGFVFVVALMALPIRGVIAGSFSDFAAIYPVQFLDGVGRVSSALRHHWRQNEFCPAPGASMSGLER